MKRRPVVKYEITKARQRRRETGILDSDGRPVVSFPKAPRDIFNALLSFPKFLILMKLIATNSI